MPAVIVVGTQWGDEGKGRVVDGLAPKADLIARFNGGDNAGHTVIAEGHTLQLHLVPSGILYPDKVSLIGAGVVVNPKRLLEEMNSLSEMGVDAGPDKLKISAAAHLVLPTHRALDGAREKARGESALGTTKRGIGPTYADKAARINLRAGEMVKPEQFGDRVEEQLKRHNNRLRSLFELETVPVEETVADYVSYARQLAPYVVDGSVLIGEALAEGQIVLCEGAQGLLLDIDHGTYPFVTSSSTIAGGALTGLGFGPHEVARVVGVAKAYTTRVGAGPFPTELTGDVGDLIRDVGDEYGTTTGRARRCGWLDAVILRYAVRINGLNEIALTKLDVLSGIETLKIAVAYEREGERIDHFPAEAGVDALSEWKPVYEEMSGWEEDITDIRERVRLPEPARRYLDRVEELLGIPITLIGVGPKREQAILS